MNLYNLSKLIRIQLDYYQPSKWYIYLPEKKFLGFVTQRKGYYRKVWKGHYEYESDVLPNDHIYIDKIYHKPDVTLFYEDGIRKTYVFDNYTQACEFVKDIKNQTNVNWIK